MRRFVLIAALALIAGATLTATRLPSNWLISPPAGRVAMVGTMPQGLALSPDRLQLAVVDAGFNPPALRILDARTLRLLRRIPLKDAFGTPVWLNRSHLLVAGGSLDAAQDVNLQNGRVTIPTSLKGPLLGWAAGVAVHNGIVAVTYNMARTVMVADLLHGTHYSYRTGERPSAVLIARHRVIVANQGESSLTVGATGNVEHEATIAVDLHPGALALAPGGKLLYVACTDADTIDVVDLARERVVARIAVGLPQGSGASPNALAVTPGGTLYATLGAENAIAEIRNGRLVARAPAGWYPDAIAVGARTVFVANGRGESSHANPRFNPEAAIDSSYVASQLVGSIRTLARTRFGAASTAQVLADIPHPLATPAQTVVRAHGPIRHVIYVIKENRTYDQVLGDLRGANGDPHLAWFGEKITPNQHAIARRFGIYDNTFADAQVSATGHSWSTAAFANDYAERFWPIDYGGRIDRYDFEDGAVASVPRNGYLWDDANRMHVAFRDYGEFVTTPKSHYPVTTHMPGLRGKIDPRYPGFDLAFSDEARIDEWQREFASYVAHHDLPPLEIIRLPNDHTWGTRAGVPTPQAYVAQNDLAFGRLVDVVSHSPYWRDTAIFAIEDDAQNGPDHVSDQRTTFFLASPYAAPGVHHAHYTTSSVLHTIELILGLPPMSIYDAVAPPLYDGFTLAPDLAPYNVLPERINLTATNAANAYGAAQSARMDFRHADQASAAELNDILAHAAGTTPP